MTGTPSPTATIERVLLYLSRRAHVARNRNERWRAADYDAAWTLVFETFYGVDFPPLPTFSLPYYEHEHVPRKITHEQRESYSRPLRRVVRSLIEIQPTTRRSVGSQWITHELECSHRSRPELVTDDAKPARHRRCHECASDGNRRAGLEIARVREAALRQITPQRRTLKARGAAA